MRVPSIGTRTSVCHIDDCHIYGRSLSSPSLAVLYLHQTPRADADVWQCWRRRSALVSKKMQLTKVFGSPSHLPASYTWETVHARDVQFSYVFTAMIPLNISEKIDSPLLLSCARVDLSWRCLMLILCMSVRRLKRC